jgi:2-keto-4-pentenoate hydratase/2-oxohepta-3-ene-1,7-dioic acid hydratase in catechol pathway
VYYGRVKIALFKSIDEATAVPAVVTAEGLVLLGDVTPAHPDPQSAMSFLITHFDELRPRIETIVDSRPAVSLQDGKLLPPLPRPSNFLCCIANYWERVARPARPLNLYIKNPDAVIGPDDEIVLPSFTEPWIFMHEAELGVVIKGPAKNISRANWRDAVFGYTGVIDVSARGAGRATWGAVSWMGKSFDTFAPVGPWITTADEIPDPQDLRVRFWNDGDLRHDYTTDDMEHGVAEIVELVTAAMTLQSGDLIACGTNHEGLGAVQDGEKLDLEVERIGRMSLTVSDPLRRSWERGVYLGMDSTNHVVSKATAG